MHHFFRLGPLWAACSLWPALALAQPVPGSAADPAALVPEFAYRSALAETPAGVETARDDWRRANAEVGQFQRGHADILQWETRQAAPASSPQSPAGGAGQRTTAPHTHPTQEKP